MAMKESGERELFEKKPSLDVMVILHFLKAKSNRSCKLREGKTKPGFKREGFSLLLPRFGKMRSEFKMFFIFPPRAAYAEKKLRNLQRKRN